MISALPEYNKVKGKDILIALVGGGPSMKTKENLDKLREFKTIIVCGSAHDYIISQGIIPTYAANCDPDLVCKNYFQSKHKDIKYLMASCCHPDLINFLGEDGKTYLWHCHSEEMYKQIIALEKTINNKDNYDGVGGGCTVGLRAISLALHLGYSNIHFFGFDSSMGESGTEHHAYEWSAKWEENLIEKIYTIQLGDKVGPLGNKFYHVAGYQLAQMEQFKDFYLGFRAYFTPTFHGQGALPDYFEIIRREHP